MRGLTLEEADHLRRAALDPRVRPIFSKGDPGYDDFFRLSDTLAARGCIRHAFEERRGRNRLRRDRITDLGCLALRVSIPGASVPIG